MLTSSHHLWGCSVAPVFSLHIRSELLHLHGFDLLTFHPAGLSVNESTKPVNKMETTTSLILFNSLCSLFTPRYSGLSLFWRPVSHSRCLGSESSSWRRSILLSFLFVWLVLFPGLQVDSRWLLSFLLDHFLHICMCVCHQREVPRLLLLMEFRYVFSPVGGFFPLLHYRSQVEATSADFLTSDHTEKNRQYSMQWCDAVS